MGITLLVHFSAISAISGILWAAILIQASVKIYASLNLFGELTWTPCGLQKPPQFPKRLVNVDGGCVLLAHLASLKRFFDHTGRFLWKIPLELALQL